jgi:Holliday junction resolvase RusA-like endonuclease
MKIVIPGMVPPSPNELRRKYRNPHVYAKLRDTWQQAIFILTPPDERKYLQTNSAVYRMIVRMIFYNSREYDPDNMAGSQKPILDALQNLGYIHNDSQQWLFLLSPTWSPAPRKFSRTEIDIAVDWNSTRAESAHGEGKVPAPA